MSEPKRSIYRTIVRLHPAEFRTRFGREMALDFEDAQATHSFGSLCLDALLSLGRQWAVCAFTAAEEQAPIARQSLLAGDYVMISLGRPGWFDMARASVLWAVLSLAFGDIATLPHARNTPGLQPGDGSQHEDLYNSADDPAPAQRSRENKSGPVIVHPDASPETRSQVAVLRRLPGSTMIQGGQSWQFADYRNRPRALARTKWPATGWPTEPPRSLVPVWQSRLLLWTALAGMVWLATVLGMLGLYIERKTALHDQSPLA
jgi:hypothetical protein